jgi:cytochrome bd-type quinol oxidase subunit 1
MSDYIPAVIILCFFIFIVYSLINLWRYNKLTKGEKTVWTIIIVFTIPSLAAGSIAWFVAKYLFYERPK